MFWRIQYKGTDNKVVDHTAAKLYRLEAVRVAWYTTKMFIDELARRVKKALFEDCARNTNHGAKPKSLDTKSGLIYKSAFCNYLLFSIFSSTFSSTTLPKRWRSQQKFEELVVHQTATGKGSCKRQENKTSHTG